MLRGGILAGAKPSFAFARRTARTIAKISRKKSRKGSESASAATSWLSSAAERTAAAGALLLKGLGVHSPEAFAALLQHLGYAMVATHGVSERASYGGDVWGASEDVAESRACRAQRRVLECCSFRSQ